MSIKYCFYTSIRSIILSINFQQRHTTCLQFTCIRGCSTLWCNKRERNINQTRAGSFWDGIVKLNGSVHGAFNQRMSEDAKSPSDQESGLQTGRPIESITDIIGDWGKWQKNIFFFYLSIAIFSAFNNLGLSLMSPKVDYWCKGTPVAFRVSVTHLNLLTSQFLMEWWCL